MKQIPVFFLALIIIFAIPAASAADLNVSVASKGDTYILWQWDTGHDITHILIDGTEICGYETTDSTLLRSGLDPASLHTINITDDINYGNGSAMTTLSANSTGWSSAVYPQSPLSPWMAIAGITVALVLIGSRKK